eukprot:gnl/TRDRNA2_/TRDRNA2_68182_c0_seq1.p1 gnl/TRDRNA2_/TRDRNA2_68182_c0~~gnl/TRDRNA2_/TRDRNA2_68182_c0_seq1.p1  ORF type:complete len:369 (-),score=48.69 gnl/TRDRNA2_/TRDRNA2_68182_c0_seq1:101-1207(-)
MCTVAFSILLASVSQATAKDQVEGYVDVHHRDLDKTTLGKIAHLAVSRPSTALHKGIVAAHGASGPAGLGGRLAKPPVGTTGYSRVTAHSPAQAMVGFAHTLHQRSSRTGLVTQAQAESEGKVFEVKQPKPIGISLVTGADGGIYVSYADRKADPRIAVGDKVLEVSASFGDEIWPAQSLPQTKMAINTRIGDIYLKIQSRGGNTDMLRTAKKSEFAQERAGGNYGAGTEMEMRKRAKSAKNTQEQRYDLLESAVNSFKAGDYKSALNDNLMAKALEPTNYVADNFARVTEIYKVATLNAACCCSMLGNIEGGLNELKDLFDAGYEDFKKINTDPYLETLREDPKFKALMDQYDERVIKFDNFKLPFR